METLSSILAWKIPWAEEPGGLQSLGLQRVRHNWPHTQKQIPYINACMQNRKKLVQMILSTKAQIETQTENKHMDTKEGKEGVG